MVKIKSLLLVSTNLHIDNTNYLILTEDGFVYGSGYNVHGQLSLSINTNTTVFVKTNLTNIISVTTGSHQSIFVNEKREVFVCGWGNYGKLGLGDEKSKDCATKLPFRKDLNMVHNHYRHLEWNIELHKYFPRSFKQNVFAFLLCLHELSLSKTYQVHVKLPKPLQKLIIKSSYN
eukprot:TRINITY_DN11821_c0_g1_i1.p1 TRINITY_DN11821_c0_g1~~TRINITY_DN11821_c0_g1_i1.p1  ORF type:complete len:175 (+),score=3.79 TRINITY_DN11821_c0_g1_i1:70-594(+)